MLEGKTFKPMVGFIKNNFQIMGILSIQLSIILQQYQFINLIFPCILCSAIISGFICMDYCINHHSLVMDYYTKLIKPLYPQTSINQATDDFRFDKIYCKYYHPYIEIKCHENVDLAIEKILHTIVKTYIASWYKNILLEYESSNMLSEIVYSFKMAINLLCCRWRATKVSLKDALIKNYISHLDMYQIAVKEFAIYNADELKPEKFQQFLFDNYGHHFHSVLVSRADEKAYLAKSVRFILPHLFSPNILKSGLITQLLEDIITYKVLLPCMDSMAHPDFIYQMIINVLNESNLYYPSDCDKDVKVTLLQNFCGKYPLNLPTNELKLKEVIQNQDLLFLFMNFMKSEGVLNLIQFYMSLEDLMKLLLNPDLKINQIEILYRQCQQIYTNFFNQTSIDRIDFDAETIQEMKEFANNSDPNNVLKLRNTSPLYNARDKVVKLLEHIFLPLFAQSGPYTNWILGGKNMYWKTANTNELQNHARNRKKKHLHSSTIANSTVNLKSTSVLSNKTHVDGVSHCESLTDIQYEDRISLESETLSGGNMHNNSYVAHSNEDDITSIGSGSLDGIPMNAGTNSIHSSEFDGSSALLQNYHLMPKDTTDGKKLSHKTYYVTKDLSKFDISILRLESRYDPNTNRHDYYFTIRVKSPALKFFRDLQSRNHTETVSLGRTTPYAQQQEIDGSTNISAQKGKQTINPLNNADSMKKFDRRSGHVRHSSDADIKSMLNSTKTYMNNNYPYSLTTDFSSSCGSSSTDENISPEFYHTANSYNNNNSLNNIMYEWSVDRRYGEFYVLESKLAEFHGVFEDIFLPLKRSYGSKDWALINAKRNLFENFIQKLCNKPELRYSELVFNFLTSSQEFSLSSFLIPDLNLGRMLKAPLRLLPEKGQNLEPFVQSFISSVEHANIRNGNQNHLPNKPGAKSHSINSSPTSEKEIKTSTCNIFDSDWNEDPSKSTTSKIRHVKKKRKQYAISGYYDYVIYFCFNIFNAPIWLIQTLIAFRVWAKTMVEDYVCWKVDQKCAIFSNPYFQTDMLTRLYNHLFGSTNSTLSAENIETASTKSKQQTAQCLLEQKLKFLTNWKLLHPKDFEAGIKTIIDCFQYPMYNKHFTYVMYDTLVTHLFPEVLEGVSSVSNLVPTTK